MKRVIREGVFETNSSSNHAVFIKRKTPGKEIPNFAVVKPYDKMMFIWGIISYENAIRFFYDYDKMTDEEREDVLKQNAELEAECESYKQIMIEECLKYEKFDVEKAEKAMNASFYNNWDSDYFTCDDYFYDGVLIDCTCMFGLNDIAHFMGMRYRNAVEFKELIQKFFADDEAYILPIGYLGDRPDPKEYD